MERGVHRCLFGQIATGLPIDQARFPGDRVQH